MKTPKNTKSEEIKQQVTKVGEMKIKKIEKAKKEMIDNINCQFRCGDGAGTSVTEHLIGCSRFTPQEQKSVSSLIYNELFKKSTVDGVRIIHEDEWPIDEIKSELTKLLTDELRKYQKKTRKYPMVLPETTKENEKYWNKGFDKAIDEAITTIERKLSE